MTRREQILLLLVVLLAAFLRFYQLGKVPAGLFSDEAAVGYNAFSLLKTGKDEFGKTWPFFFTSFGEGKLPLYIYQSLPWVALFGLKEFAVRFSGALMGTLSVFLVYFFVKDAVDLRLPRRRDRFEKALYGWLPIASSLILALMPWQIHFSRGVFGQESLFWVILGSWLSLKAIKNDDLKLWLGSFLSFSISLLIYHSPRVFVPFWLAYVLVLLFKKEGVNRLIGRVFWAFLLTGLIWFFLFLSPMGMSRAKSVSVFSEQSGVLANLSTTLIEIRNQPLWLSRILHNKVEAYARDILGRYFSHFDPGFLFFAGDPLRPRYRVPNLGQLLLISLPFFLIGIYFLVEKKLWPFLVFLAISPLPGALSFETPSSVRSIFMVVPLAVLIALGLVWFFFRLEKIKGSFKMVIIVSLTAGFIYNFVYYLDAYYVHAPAYQPYYWQYGYKKLVSKVNQLSPNYERIEITDKRGTPYIFFLFYNQYDPQIWQAQVNENIEAVKAFNFIAIRKMDNLEFISQTCPAQSPKNNVLYVCTEEDHPVKLIDAGIVRKLETISYQDGQPAFIFMDKVPGKEISKELLDEEE